MAEQPKQPPLFEPDDLADKIEKQADKMGWSTDSVRRMLVGSTPSGKRLRKKTGRGHKSKVPDNDSLYDENWNIPLGVITDEQAEINRKGIAEVRAAGQKPEVLSEPYDAKAMVSSALAGWDQYIADHKQIKVDTEVAERGVYVGLDERHAMLEAIAGIYAHRNRSKGFRKAIDSDAHAEELHERYKRPEVIAGKMGETALKSERERNTAVLDLVKSDELKIAGFGLGDIALAAATTEHDIRTALGEDVRYADREKALKPVRAAAKKRLSTDSAE